MSASRLPLKGASMRRGFSAGKQSRRRQTRMHANAFWSSKIQWGTGYTEVDLRRSMRTVPQPRRQIRHAGEHLRVHRHDLLVAGQLGAFDDDEHVGAAPQELGHVLEVVEIRAGVGRLRLGAHHGYDLC